MSVRFVLLTAAAALEGHVVLQLACNECTCKCVRSRCEVYIYYTRCELARYVRARVYGPY